MGKAMDGRMTAVALALAVSAAAANASSEAAWRAFEVRATRACVAASGLRDGRASAIVGFDDRAGMVAMLVSARPRTSPPARLCLYDKRAGRAYVDEAEAWTAPPRRASAGR